MKDTWPYITLAISIGIAIEIFRIRSRRKKDYREFIEPDLKKNGYTFISSTTPKKADVNPFPLFEIKIGGIQTKTPIGRGEYVELRIIRFKDPNNETENTSWVKLDFAAFTLQSATWNPKLKKRTSSGKEATAHLASP